jgi:putative ATP-dependent endonuclease of the OLD family
MRKTRLHLDASRSAALFAERLVLVEGVTDAAVLRELGWVWAGQDLDKQAFVDALSIVPMGTKVGPWAVRLLATKDFELCRKIGVLRDSDLEAHETPVAPPWLAEHDGGVAAVFHSHPTLEPLIAEGNEQLALAALGDMGRETEPGISAEQIGTLFRSAKSKTNQAEAVPAGPLNRRKGEFALAMASRIREARLGGNPVLLASQIVDLFDFVYSPSQVDAEILQPEETPDPSESAEES